MAVHSKGAKVFVGGYNLSPYLNEASPSAKVNAVDVTAFGPGAKQYIAGLRDGTIKLGGFWTGDAGQADAVLTAALGSASDLAATVCPGGDAVGERAILCSAQQTSHDTGIKIGDAVTLTGDIQTNKGLDFGACIHALAARSSSGTGSSYADLGAAGTTGYSANCHTTAGAGTVAVQHSADHITFVDLTTFTVAGVGGQRTISSPTATINRYVRARWAPTGSITFALAVAKR